MATERLGLDGVLTYRQAIDICKRAYLGREDFETDAEWSESWVVEQNDGVGAAIAMLLDECGERY